jgi:hypothetical protein
VIGVLCRHEQRAVFTEFFQLFKTPWELYEPGGDYDVVLVTTGEVPAVDVRLLVIYGADLIRDDEHLASAVQGARRGAAVLDRGRRVPIHGALLTFTERMPSTAYVTTDDGAIAAVRVPRGRGTIARFGYDLAEEVRSLLSVGQAPGDADVPTLDLHIAMLRALIVEAGVPLVEIAPAPAGYAFAVCLTHDIDFAGIRYHRLDHTMWGFVYRATVGALVRTLSGRLRPRQCLQSWRAVAALPFVFIGWARDFWEPFGWYLHVEHGLRATYFLIPFKGCPGERVAGARASRRAAAYDVHEIAGRLRAVTNDGGELAVHGIDAWHSVDRGKAELERIAALNGHAPTGVRMHWLCRDEATPRVLEEAGYAWDATLGFNETVGYRNGTTQPFRAAGATTLLALPLHIQDGALFYPSRLDLTEAEAWERCMRLVADADRHGGALTVLWHDRSHAPERFWGDFYVRLVDALKRRRAWFGTAGEIVRWFARRRAVQFERVTGGVRLAYEGERIEPPLRVRVYDPDATQAGRDAWTEVAWDGSDADAVGPSLARPAARHATAAIGGRAACA